MTAFVKIEGKVQDYLWGGHDFIPNTLQSKTIDRTKPSAEYWLGTHPAAPSITSTTKVALDQFLYQQSSPTLQFLFKVLDVKEMLSIQSHPTKEQAIAGFEKENALGIDLKANNRNYKDKNDKPELMLALSEFWLLHGLRPIKSIQGELSRYKFLDPLKAILESEGLITAFAFALNDNDHQVASMCVQLAEHVTNNASKFRRNDIEFWIQQWVKTHPGVHKGLLTLFFFNLVKLDEGQAIYQPAGLLHAYLEGQNIELMANSDNVLRAGLTPKHIDVKELLNTCTLSTSDPERYLIQTNKQPDGSMAYPTPFTEFQLDELDSKDSHVFDWESKTPEVVFCYRGEITLTHKVESLTLRQGQSALILPKNLIHATLTSARVFRAKNLASES